MEKITLTGVPETMLQTVFARAQETQKANHKITDEKAVELEATGRPVLVILEGLTMYLSEEDVRQIFSILVHLGYLATTRQPGRRTFQTSKLWKHLKMRSAEKNGAR